MKDTQEFQRARKPEEKEIRRQSILEAARGLAREAGPIAIGLNEIGRRSGVSKPNLYRYFESREEILLRLFIVEIQEAATETEQFFAVHEGTIDNVTECIAHAFLNRPLLCQLMGMVSSILEHNISAETIALCRREIGAQLTRMSVVTARALPWLGVEDAEWTMRSISLFVAGIWPAANPSKAAAEVLSRPEFAMMKPDANQDLKKFVRILLLGLQTQS